MHCKKRENWGYPTVFELRRLLREIASLTKKTVSHGERSEGQPKPSLQIKTRTAFDGPFARLPTLLQVFRKAVLFCVPWPS